MNNYEDEAPRHKKKAKKVTPKKARHKHEQANFVAIHTTPVLSREHGFITEDRYDIWLYCPICGKVFDRDTSPRWYTYNKKSRPELGIYLGLQYTEEAKREFDPATRTLPCYRLPDGIFTKYIEEGFE